MSAPRLVLCAPSSHERLVKHSRFVAHAVPARSPDEALAARDRLADPGATHNCWAYRIDALYRFSDDGEPGGSAGRPILAAIDGQQVDRVVVLVTRYFGGIKLGVGGLVRAYGGAAAECLRIANKTELRQLTKMETSCTFAQRGRVRAALEAAAVAALEERFESDGVSLSFEAEAGRLEEIRRSLADLSRGAIQVRADEANHG